MNTPWLEYGIVVASLVITVAVGLYNSRTTSMQDYMLGGRKMSVLPISLSIVATYLTGASMVSSAQEVYLYGLQMWFTAFMYIVYGVVFAYVVLPVSFNVKSASTFEFFDRRFKGHVRKYASLMYALETILLTATSQFVPAASLSQATGFPVFYTACGLSVICCLYTATGGFKAVTYVDSFQAFIFLGVIIVLFFAGLAEAGGFTEVWNKAEEGHRLEFLDLHPTYNQRYSTFLFFFSGVTNSIRSFMSPSFHQRVVAMPSYKHAKIATIWSTVLTGVCLIFTFTMGLIVYAYFAGCDPLLEGKDINSYATILPYFVGELSKTIPGLTGLFLSAVLAAGLSTTASYWNTVSCTLYEDIVTLFLPPTVSKKKSLKIITGLVIIVAVISTCSVLITASIPSILEATVTLRSFTSSSSFILYFCGMVLPWINDKGAIVGSIACSLVTTWIAVCSQNAKITGEVINMPKILTNAQCIVNGTTFAALNKTITTGVGGYGMVTLAAPNTPWYTQISFSLYCVPGMIVGLIIAYVTSYLTGHEDLSKIDPEMIIEQMRWVLPPRKSTGEDVRTPLKTVDDKSTAIELSVD